MKHYHGARCGNDIATIVVVELDEHSGLPNLYALPMYTWLRNHSPTGFEWGYRGSGPAQAAFAILYDYFDGNHSAADTWHQTFKDQVLGRLDADSWCITETDIEAWLSDGILPSTLR